MPVKSLALPSGKILWADGIHDDADALNAWARGDFVSWPNGRAVSRVIDGHKFFLTGPIMFCGGPPLVLRYSYLSTRPTDEPWSPEIGRIRAMAAYNGSMNDW